MDTYLEVRWSVSRGRDTYGYNICTVTDRMTRESFKCSGGGYDLLGTSFAGWLNSVHAERLTEIADEAYYKFQAGAGSSVNDGGLYGSHASFDGSGAVESVRVDGACGLESAEKIAKRIGVTVRHALDNRGNVVGFFVSDVRGGA